jgi:hypothetical protein
MSTSRALWARTPAAPAAAFVALLAARGARAEDVPAPATGSTPSAPAAPTKPATAPTPPPDPDAPAKATRRSGFTFGLDLGVGVASIVGYPNDVTKIGYASYYSATGPRPAGTLEAWIGGANMDWFTVSLGFKGSQLLATSPDKARAIGMMFHLEGFPLWPLGGHLRDLGVRFDAGLGTATVTDASGTKIVDGGSTSTIGGGVFYEALRAWKTAHGPFLMGDYIWSDTARRPAIFIGWRSVIYSGP